MSTPVYDTPMALNADLSRTDGLDPHLARSRCQRYVSELRKAIAGPIPVEEFFGRFVGKAYPTSDPNAQLSARYAFRSVPPTAETPAQIYEPLMNALNIRTKNKSRCPGFVFEDTARRSLHPTHLGYAKPHISCFAQPNLDAVRRSSRRSRAELGYAELFIQVTVNPAHDFFNDPPPDADPENRAAHEFLTRFHDLRTWEKVEEAFGLHIAFVTEVFARQHRICFFSISMAGSRARLIRWDRTGCSVTESFDIREHPEHLCTFLWRFSQTSTAARGHDTTVEPALSEDERRFRGAVKKHVHSQLGVEGEELDLAITQHYSPGRVAIMTVYAHRARPSKETSYRFVVSRPVITPLSLIGRGTRGYWAMEYVSSEMMFLKDTWRVSSQGAVEGDLLYHLNNLAIRNVPSFKVHGDLPEYVIPGEFDDRYWQRTHTHFAASGPSVCCVAGKRVSAKEFRHYRLVMGTVGYGLSTLRGTEELLHATYDVFTAMRDALAKDARIHRDISLGNIILVKEPGRDIRRGYLIDWEVSDRVDDTGLSTHSGRAGTWLFMSWRMLDVDHSDRKHTFMDDVESLIHVVTYCALLYLPHELSGEDLAKVIAEHFHRRMPLNAGDGYGGTMKFVNAYTRAVFKQVQFGSQALLEWLNGMLDLQIPPANPPQKFTYGPLWTPDDVDAYWSNFLATHALERDNRVVHRLSDDGHHDVSPSHATVPSIATPLGKRPATQEGSADASGPPRKRRRSARLQARVVGVAPIHPDPEGPRRSARISGRKVIPAQVRRPSMRTSTPKSRPVRQQTGGGCGGSRVRR